MKQTLVDQVLANSGAITRLISTPGLRLRICTGKLAGSGVVTATGTPWDNSFSNAWDKGWANYGK